MTPGLLLASLFPAIIGSRLVRADAEAAPAVRWQLRKVSDAAFVCQPGSLYLTQRLAFRGSATVGATLHATVQATRVVGRRAVFDTRCVLEASGRVIVDGQALALLPAAAAVHVKS